MKVKAKGRVIDVVEAKHAEKGYITRRTVTVKESDGDEPSFTFFGKDGIEASAGIRVGDDVQAEGRCSSRVWKDKRYSDLNGVALTRLLPKESDREPGEDDDLDPHGDDNLPDPF